MTCHRCDPPPNVPPTPPTPRAQTTHVLPQLCVLLVMDMRRIAHRLLRFWCCQSPPCLPSWRTHANPDPPVFDTPPGYSTVAGAPPLNAPAAAFAPATVHRQALTTGSKDVKGKRGRNSVNATVARGQAAMGGSTAAAAAAARADRGAEQASIVAGAVASALATGTAGVLAQTALDMRDAVHNGGARSPAKVRTSVIDAAAPALPLAAVAAPLRGSPRVKSPARSSAAAAPSQGGPTNTRSNVGVTKLRGGRSVDTSSPR